jgi:hypothetical protein
MTESPLLVRYLIMAVPARSLNQSDDWSSHGQRPGTVT